MQWQSRPLPKENDVRVIKRFALLPTRLEGNITVWLEHYNESQKYVKIATTDKGIEWVMGWLTIRKTLERTMI